MRYPGPYRSQLIPYVEQIKAWRKSGKTWKQVTEELAKLGVKTDPGSAYRFIMRWRKQPYPYGKDQAPEPTQPVSSVPADPVQPASSKPAPSREEPTPEELNPYQDMAEEKIHIPITYPKPKKHE